MEQQTPNLSENAVRVLKARYLRRDAQRRIIETPEELFERVACAVAQEESWVGCAGEAARWPEEFHRLLVSLDFLPKGYPCSRRRQARVTAEALTGPFFPLCHEQAESVLSCTLEGFSAGNYGVMPFLRQPDFHGRARDDADAAARLFERIERRSPWASSPSYAGAEGGGGPVSPPHARARH